MQCRSKLGDLQWLAAGLSVTNRLVRFGHRFQAEPAAGRAQNSAGLKFGYLIAAGLAVNSKLLNHY